MCGNYLINSLTAQAQSARNFRLALPFDEQLENFFVVFLHACIIYYQSGNVNRKYIYLPIDIICNV